MTIVRIYFFHLFQLFIISLILETPVANKIVIDISSPHASQPTVHVVIILTIYYVIKVSLTTKQ